MGTLTHMVWSCLNLRSFWSEIFNLVSKVMGVFAKPNTEQAILSINMSKYPIAVRSIATHILLAARSAIMYRWKSKDIPSVRDVTVKINMIAEYERIMAYRDGNTSKYESNWSPWKTFSLTP